MRSRLVLVAIITVGVLISPAWGQNFVSRSDNDLVNLRLRLGADGTYTFANQVESCFLWFHEEGTWSEDQPGFIILRSVVARPIHAQVRSQMGPPSLSLRVKVKDERGNPLSGVKVSLLTGVDEATTDENGSARLTRKFLELDSASMISLSFIFREHGGSPKKLCRAPTASVSSSSDHL